MSRLIALVLFSLWCVAAFASEGYGMPKIDIGKGGECVKDPKWMRKNHMHLLKHQRDETVHKGIREKEFSLKNCIDCHASTRDDSVTARADSFCVGCHRYEAVTIDCFECHSSKRGNLAQKEQ